MKGFSAATMSGLSLWMRAMRRERNSSSRSSSRFFLRWNVPASKSAGPSVSNRAQPVAVEEGSSPRTLALLFLVLLFFVVLGILSVVPFYELGLGADVVDKLNQPALLGHYPDSPLPPPGAGPAGKRPARWQTAAGTRSGCAHPAPSPAQPALP